MHPRRDFHFAREEEINGFARFMIVLGYLKVMPFSQLIRMALVILERMYLKTREMRSSSITRLERHLHTIMIHFACDGRCPINTSPDSVKPRSRIRCFATKHTHLRQGKSLLIHQNGASPPAWATWILYLQILDRKGS